MALARRLSRPVTRARCNRTVTALVEPRGRNFVSERPPAPPALARPPGAAAPCGSSACSSSSSSTHPPTPPPPPSPPSLLPPSMSSGTGLKAIAPVPSAADFLDIV